MGSIWMTVRLESEYLQCMPLFPFPVCIEGKLIMIHLAGRLYCRIRMYRNESGLSWRRSSRRSSLVYFRTYESSHSTGPSLSHPPLGFWCCIVYGLVHVIQGCCRWQHKFSLRAIRTSAALLPALGFVIIVNLYRDHESQYLSRSLCR